MIGESHCIHTHTHGKFVFGSLLQCYYTTGLRRERIYLYIHEIL